MRIPSEPPPPAPRRDVLGFVKSLIDFGTGTTRLLAAFIGLVATVVTISLAIGGSSSGTTPPPPVPSVQPMPTVQPRTPDLTEDEPTVQPRTREPTEDELADALANGCWIDANGTEFVCP